MNLGFALDSRLSKSAVMATELEGAGAPPDRATAPPLPTKLQPPRSQGHLLERPDLIQRLRQGRERKLTLVCAPAGYGKSTLLAQWAAVDAAHTPFVWMSLDERDSDPTLLFGQLISAIRTVHATAGERSLKALTAGPEAITETAIPLLLDELAGARQTVIVLDDWQVVSSHDCDEALGLLVDQAPASIQIVVASRSDPRVRTARLRARGELVELRARDLAISASQASELFRHEGVPLTDADLERLTERMEGWVAGLCLALLALKEEDAPAQLAQRFSGDSRHVFDYLAQDVLDGIDPELREFMIHSSALDRLSAPLCNAVLGRSDSASMLTMVEQANLFLVSLDATGDEFRYHHLLRSVLRRELAAQHPDPRPSLHARASRWYEEHGDTERAIDHAIAGGDLTRASALVFLAAVPLLSAGRMATLDRWFAALSSPAAHADRQLAVMRALAAGLSARGRTEVERWLSVADDGPEMAPLANGITSMTSCVAMVSASYLSRGIEAAERSARLVLESEPVESPWRYAGLVPLGQSLFLSGRLDAARAPLEEARTLPGAREHLSTSLGMAYLALVELAAGDGERAEQIARDALALAESLGHGATAGAANGHLAVGCVLLRRSDLYGAVAHLRRAVELALEPEASYWHTHALLHLAGAERVAGNGEAADDALRRARSALDELPDAGALAALYDEVSRAEQQTTPRRGLDEQLSEAELRVLRGLAAGRSISTVSQELWLSSNTVKSHRRSIYRKLGVHTREQLHAVISELELIAPSSVQAAPVD